MQVTTTLDPSTPASFPPVTPDEAEIETPGPGEPKEPDEPIKGE